MPLNNALLYNAAIAGASGGNQQRWIVTLNPGDYSTFRAAVVAFATELDSQIAPVSGGANLSMSNLLTSIVLGVMADRLVISADRETYEEIAGAIAALFAEQTAVLEPTGDVPPGDITPGLEGEVMTSWKATPSADAQSRWLYRPGPTTVYLYPYLVRAGADFTSAMIAMLEENPTARTFIIPPDDYVQTAQIGDFLGGDGLRGNIEFICQGRATITRPVGAIFEAMFAFPTGTSNVTWSGIEFHLADTAVVGCKAIQAYNNTRWKIQNCAFICDDVPINQGNGIALGLFGCYNTTVTECYFNRGQCGFAGLGYGCNGVIFTNNVCDNVHDFAVSAVCGPPAVTPLQIKNVVISNNTIRGINGTGGIFVGSDGGSSPADVVQGVSITNNTLIGTIEFGYVGGVRASIVFCSGIVTSQVDISGNQIADDAGSAQSQYGIYISNGNGTTSFTTLSVSNNNIGPLGAGGGVNGIYCDTLILDDSQFINNTLNGNRGLFVANCQNTKIAGNRIFNATSNAIQVRASARNVSGLEVSDNFAESTGAFTNGILFECTAGAFTFQAWLDNNKMSSASGSALAYVPGAGSGSFVQTDQKFLSGAANAAMITATTFDRDPIAAPGF